MTQHLVNIVLLISLIPIGITCITNPIFEKETKKTFLTAAFLTMLQILTEIIRTSNIAWDGYKVFLGKTLVFLTFVIPPFLGYFFIKMMCPIKVWGKIRDTIFVYAGVNIIVSIVSMFKGVLFTFSNASETLYVYGPLYIYYFIINILLLFLSLVLDIYKKITSKYNFTWTFSVYLIFISLFLLKVFDFDVRMMWVICTIIIITYFLDYVNHLIQLDSLSGVYNRRMYDYDLENCKSKNNITIINVDINYFKKYNDLYGHKAGDKVIQLSAKEINDEFEMYGRTYRIGGDEFCIICRKIKDNQIDEIFEKINEALLKKIQKKCFNVILSYGYEHYSRNKGQSISSTVKNADKNMYTYKKMVKAKNREN